MILLIDMSLPPAWVPFLADCGIRSLHWSSIGAHDADDEVIFRHAIDHSEIVFTHDLDFGTLLAYTRSRKPSVIQARVQDPSPERIGETLVATLNRFQERLRQGAIVTILPSRTRVRILPL